jgi:hypothetical protein
LGATTVCGSLEQRRGRGREDVVGVGGVEVDRAVDLEDVAATGRVAGDVDAGEVEPERGDRARRERTRCRRRTHARAEGAQGDVRPPFAREGAALDRADDATAGDDEAEVAAGRLDESLHQRAVATEPAPAPEAFEPRPQLVLVATAVDVAAPAAEAGLHHVRGRKGWNRHLAEVRRLRVRDPRPGEEEGGRELVMGGEQASGRFRSCTP